MMEAATDTYLPSLEHFMAEVLLRNEDVDYELLTGHWENLNPFSVEYLRHMLILVKGVIRGDIPTATTPASPAAGQATWMPTSSTPTLSSATRTRSDVR